jgi:hypothetical protein
MTDFRSVPTGTRKRIGIAADRRGFESKEYLVGRHESFSARQGVEDDDIRVICLGGRVMPNTFAWELARTFLETRFSGAERPRGRLAKVAGLESGEART